MKIGDIKIHENSQMKTVVNACEKLSFELSK